jgi:tetratricopeptide (TPR) repeat protein
MKEESLAIEHFKKAMELGSVNPGLYYNYGLLLQQKGKKKEAEGVFLQGIKLQPRAINLNYALAFFYFAEQVPQKARPYAQVLYSLDPQNPDYQAMFHELGIIR